MSKPDWVKSDYGTSYEEMIESWSVDVLSTDQTGSYEGDLFALLADGERRGFLSTGYGSCPGCDALEAVAPWGDRGDWSGVEQLRAALSNDIHWEPSAAALVEWLSPERQELQWYWHDDDNRAVLSKYRTLLGVG